MAIARSICIDKGRIPFHWILSRSTLRCLYLSTCYWTLAHVFVKDGHNPLTMPTAIHVIHGKRVRWSIRHLLVEKEIPYKP
jgi:hypothetical protein